MAVMITKEVGATAVAPLGDMMRYAWDDDTRDAGHA